LLVYGSLRLPGLDPALAGNTQPMADDQVTYLDGVMRFLEADDADPVQQLWRLQNEAGSNQVA